MLNRIRSLTRMRSGGLATAGMVLAAAAALFAAPESAQAVPSYARQTGLACEACHTVFPELTPFGRQFKLNAYTLTTKPAVSDEDQSKGTNLSLADMPPLSVMIQADTSWSNNNRATGGQGNETQFPQQLSLFYAGKISDHLGAQMQLTFQQASGTFGIDNSEIRFADQAVNNKLVYGLTLNDAVTMSDLWNSTTIWAAGAGAFGPGVSDTGIPATFIEGLSAGHATGAGGFVDWNGNGTDSVYLESDLYRTSNFGTQTAPSTAVTGNSINGVAPYWRAAYEHDWGHQNFEIGTFGMYGRYSQNGVAVDGIDNDFLDTALDAQYQFIGEHNIFSLAGNLIHENQTINNNLVLANNYNKSSVDMNHLRLTGSYFYDRKYGGSIAFNHLNGDTNVGSSANTQYEVFELDYMPWLNTKLLAQYTLYNWVNAQNYNYNGAGTQVNDGNTFMLGLWTAF
ncbi:hypothetical protein GALL_409240 [mine drainage metagenome]|uniref:Cytochrome C n=1 Tax=mine drainage metagenome TaxID=410659 RepID=A0A1J5QBP0_9ZZZZ